MATTQNALPMSAQQFHEETATVVRRPSWARQMLRHPMGIMGALLVLIWVAGALAAPATGPCCPLNQDILSRLQGPTATHLMGTDGLGQDVLTAVLYGGRISLSIGAATVLVGAVVGILIGIIAGFWGGVIDEILMRFTDLVLAFPIIILAMSIDAALGPSLFNALIALAAVWWPSYARLARSLVLSLKSTTYVEAARAVGLPTWRILLTTILPNMISPMVVLATLDVGNAILTIAALGFLGLGVTPSTPEWGYMISMGREYTQQWWMSLFPGIAIFTSIMGCNFFGDALRDVLDPRG